MGTLLEAIGIVLETHFRFGFPNESPIGDSLITLNPNPRPSADCPAPCNVVCGGGSSCRSLASGGDNSISIRASRRDGELVRLSCQGILVRLYVAMHASASISHDLPDLFSAGLV